MTKLDILEWSGVATAIIYSLLIAINIGAEFVGFCFDVCRAPKPSIFQLFLPSLNRPHRFSKDQTGYARLVYFA